MNFGKWIWSSLEDHPDEYVCFYKRFHISDLNVSMDISCDSNYELYVNGKLAGFGQYADYPYDKVYDHIDLSPYCKIGENQICVMVWYYGKDFSTYYKGAAGLIYEISQGSKVIAWSDEATICKNATDYISGLEKVITGQLGFSYTYDVSGYDGWKQADFIPNHFFPACVLENHPDNFRERPIHRLQLKPFQEAVKICDTENIYDLGAETVGYLSLSVKAPKGAKINIAFGEHLIEENGISAVPRKIGGRDFSVDLIANGEWFSFSNYMRRLGCRYLQVICEYPVEIQRIGLYPAEYPVEILSFNLNSLLRQKIYDTAVHTLRCCMFEHYEDCPWREQALYNVDSRNQMLCCYYAFGDYGFARASLDLMGRDHREDGLFHICFPSKIDLVIPFFSIFYIIQMREYAEYSNDHSLIVEYYDRMLTLLDAFRRRKEDGLITNFHSEKRYWNFYEWSPTLDGGGRPNPKSFDLMLNTTYSMALQSMSAMADKIGRHSDAKCFFEEALCLNREIHAQFFSKQTGLYRTTLTSESYSQLGNAFAVLCGAADHETAVQICKKLKKPNKDFIPATLSMKAFLYDALLQTDQAGYAKWVLEDIDATYADMLDQGATSFWETIDGAKAFDNARSLCHGWSAIPIIYYRKLLDQPL